MLVYAYWISEFFLQVVKELEFGVYIESYGTIILFYVSQSICSLNYFRISFQFMFENVCTAATKYVVHFCIWLSSIFLVEYSPHFKLSIIIFDCCLLENFTVA